MPISKEIRVRRDCFSKISAKDFPLKICLFPSFCLISFFNFFANAKMSKISLGVRSVIDKKCLMFFILLLCHIFSYMLLYFPRFVYMARIFRLFLFLHIL